jgi:uncharacterized protein YlxW (UPF0749 family)
VPELRDMLQELPQVEDEAVAYTLSLKVEPRCALWFVYYFFKNYLIFSLIHYFINLFCSHVRMNANAEHRDTTEAIETLLMEEAKLKQQVQQLQVRIADLEMENRRYSNAHPRTHHHTHTHTHTQTPHTHNRTRTVWEGAE